MGTTLNAALAFYDRLEPVGVEEMIGSWRGEGLPTGNPLDGLLERFGYDALPINDVFRKVDDDTLVGAMDLRGLEMPFMFVLRRDRQ